MIDTRLNSGTVGQQNVAGTGPAPTQVVPARVDRPSAGTPGAQADIVQRIRLRSAAGQAAVTARSERDVSAAAVMVADKARFAESVPSPGADAARHDAAREELREASAEVAKQIKALESQQGVLKELETELSALITSSEQRIEQTQREIRQADAAAGGLVLRARDLKVRKDAAEKSGDPVEIGQVAREISALLREKNDLTAKRDAAARLISTETRRLEVSHGLLGLIVPIISDVGAQLSEAKSMLETNDAQANAIDMTAKMNQVRAKMAEILRLIEGPHAARFQALIEGQAGVEVAAEEEQRAHESELDRVVAFSKARNSAAIDDAFSGLLTAPTPEAPSDAAVASIAPAMAPAPAAAAVPADATPRRVIPGLRSTAALRSAESHGMGTQPDPSKSST